METLGERDAIGMLRNPATKPKLVLEADAGFEACAAAHLADLPPDAAWKTREEWDSFYPPDYRNAWQYLLARYARAERLHETFPCSLERRLRSVYRAAVKRRGVGQWNAVQELFVGARQAVERGGNPLFDALDLPDWKHEIELLARDVIAYRRDIQRAQRFCAPLENESGEYEVAECALIESPESILFIERAWRDRIHSLDNGGFAVVVVCTTGQTVVALDPRLQEKGLKLPDFPLTGVKWTEARPIKIGSREVRLEENTEGWWTRRIQGSVKFSYLEQTVRVQLEGRIFADGVKFSFAREKELCELRLERDGRDSRDFSFYEVKLRENKFGPVFKPSLVESVGRALWTLVRPDERAGTPPNFAAEHRQGDFDMLSVWSRKGLAVACCQDGKDRQREQINCLKDLLARMNAPPASPDERLETYRTLEEDLAHPNGRLLRKLYQATEHSRMYGTLATNASLVNLRELAEEQKKLAQAAACAREQQKRLLDSQDKGTNKLVDMQRNLELLEVFIIGYYGVSFTYYVYQAAKEPARSMIPLFMAPIGLIIGGLAYWFMAGRSEPEKDPKQKLAKKVLLIAVLAVTIIGLAVLFYSRATGKAEQTYSGEEVRALSEQVRKLEQSQKTIIDLIEKQKAPPAAAPSPPAGKKP